jgi:hypothetical protein
MSLTAPDATELTHLTRGELDALLDAAAWYAKYHHRMIADEADDPSAMAVARRDRFRELHTGLRKLGVRLRTPDGLHT